MSYAEYAIALVFTFIGASHAGRIKAQREELNRLRETVVTLAKQNVSTLEVCSKTLRRLEELEREVAAYRTVGWMRDASKN